MSFAIGLVIGLIVGGCVGILTAALVIVAAASDREAQRMLSDVDFGDDE